MAKWRKLKDGSEMMFGKWKGTKMGNIPAKELLDLYNDGEMAEGNVKDYILDNIEILKDEIK